MDQNLLLTLVFMGLPSAAEFRQFMCPWVLKRIFSAVTLPFALLKWKKLVKRVCVHMHTHVKAVTVF